MLVLETEFEGFNTQALTISQSQQSTQPKPDKKAFFGHEEFLMMIDAIQYSLVKFAEQLEEVLKIEIMRSVFELWTSWLIKHNVTEEVKRENEIISSIKISDALSILWVSCQLNRLPISFNDLIDLLEPVELPHRYKEYISKNQLKHLNIRLSSNKQNLYAMLNYFDYIHLPPPNIQLYACYVLADMKLPISIAKSWYRTYNSNYWKTKSSYYRITFDIHVIWSLYAYVLHLFQENKIDFDFSSWCCQWYRHLSNCSVPTKNSKLSVFLQQFQEHHHVHNLMRKLPISVPNDFTSNSFENSNFKFSEYCKEAAKKIPQPKIKELECHCFELKYCEIEVDLFTFMVQKLFIYFSPSFDISTESIQQAELRYMNAIIDMENVN